MSPFRRSVPVAALLVTLAVHAAPADEVTDKQKKVAEENLKKADLGKTALAETADLFVCGALPEARAKAVAEALQKTYKHARKGLQFEEKEEAWKGKLAVYYLPEREKYTKFMRLVVGQKPELSYHVSVRGDEPFVVSGVEVAAKATDAEVAAELAPLVGGALLASKAGSGTPVPPWVRSGFGRAAAYRAEGPNGRRFGAYKAQAQKAVLGGGKGPATIADVWAGERADADVLGTSLMDYFAFGPGAASFPKFLSALKPGDNGDAPTVAMVLESMDVKAPMLEAAWRKWVQGGMVATVK